MMENPSVVVVDGNLEADGTIQLDQPLDLPPGRVRITLQPLPATQTQPAYLPDRPWPDDATAAPFDLPFPGLPQRVYPRQASRLLPDPLVEIEEESDDL